MQDLFNHIHIYLFYSQKMKKYHQSIDLHKLLIITCINLFYMAQTGSEQKSKINLPRVNPEFIGVSHQLEAFKRNRRQVELEQRAVENRVAHLEKEEMNARKNLMKKKMQLQKIINVKERQEQESEQKMRLRQEKMEELERLKKHNQYMRIMHKTNLTSNISMMRDRNKSDYSRIRRQRFDGEFSKRMDRQADLRQKRDQWISLNLEKEKGKMKVDNYYKKKNKEHLQEYQSRIQKEDQKIHNKINSIKALQAHEEKLRTIIQQTTLKNSRMQQLIKGVSRVRSPLDTTSIQAELFGTSRKKKIKLNNLKNSNQTISFTDRQSTTFRDGQDERPSKDEVEQNIQIEEENNKEKQGIRVVHKKRKNKHVNRYRQYEAF